MTYLWILFVGITFTLYTASLCESSLALKYPVLARYRRQTQCPRGRWSCGGNSNQCIDKYLVCDGRPDCTNSADETEGVCERLQCASYTYRCAYGACVSGDAKCNGVQDCADGSDESLPECSNNRPDTSVATCRRTEFRCANGQCISKTLICDGTANCEDGSDETRAECSATQCPAYAYRCDYGACVPGGSRCNGIRNCFDGSDESPRICGRPTPASTTTTLAPFVPAPSSSSDSNDCIVPSDASARYTVANTNKVATPGTSLAQFSVLRYECIQGLHNYGATDGYCIEGRWNGLPRCTRGCKIRESLTYDTECNLGDGKKLCPRTVPPGTRVVQKCKPEYKPQSFNLQFQTCGDSGEFDVPLVPCAAKCGLPIPAGTPFVIGGQKAKIGDFPWHAGIYINDSGSEPYKQICGGSIVNAITILSAAHCFFIAEHGAETMLPKERFAVAVGKIYRDWNADEPYQQFSILSKLEIPQSYNGFSGNYADDIAILILKTPITFSQVVRPVCVDWYPSPFTDEGVNEEGKVAGWGLIKEFGDPSTELKWISLPRVSNQECKRNSPADFRNFLTSDKFCAGYLTGSSVCQGDSGGGLSFPVREGNEEVYYIKGIVSVGPLKETTCNSFKYTAFTKVQSHINWLISNSANRGLL